MTRPPLHPTLLALPLLIAAIYPVIARRYESVRVGQSLDSLTAAPQRRTVVASDAMPAWAIPEGDPALAVRVEELNTLLSSWQTIGGCGSSGATGSAGIKWIGRSTTGGLFNVQVQSTYSELGAAPYRDHNFFLNTLITRDVGQQWNVGVNLPFVYKYFDDPYMTYTPSTVPPTPAVDYSNGGLGDISVQGTRRFGSINDTALTLVVGFPTGTYTAAVPGHTALGQQRQLGFGKMTGAAVLDHTIDEVWGVIILGGALAYRGGQNSPLENYRSPSATGYGYTGYFWGPFVPAFGLSVTGFKAHDRDQSQDENSALLVLSPNFSLEWSTDWIALLAGVSFPYQYDAIRQDSNGVSRSPWGWGPWLVALGVAVSPF